MTTAGTEAPQDRLLRRSLVFVWLATAVVSVAGLHGQSAALLADAGWRDPQWMQAVILAGAAADAALGIAMWRWPGRRVYAAALTLMALMTLAATVMQPLLWLHPLGPLTKNIPIAAILLVLMRRPASPTTPADPASPVKNNAP